MNNPALIPILQSVINYQQIQTVNARDLHLFLGVGKDFSSWIKVQIERARLVKNRDFVVFTQKGENSKGGRPTSEYHITIDAGKHIAMMSGTDKGFEVRDYFIECERLAKQSHPDPLQALEDPATMRTLLLSYAEKVIQRDKLIATIQPKAEVADRIAASDGFVNLTDAAKILKVRPREFSRWLQAHRWLYKRVGSRALIPYQDKIQAGYLDLKYVLIPAENEPERTFPQTIFLPKGIARLAAIFAKGTQEVAA